MTERSQKEMVVQETLFLTQPVEMKRSSIPGRKCSVRDKYSLRAQMGQKRSSSFSPPVKSFSDGMVNSSKQESGTEGFCVLSTKSGRNEKVQDLQPRE